MPTLNGGDGSVSDYNLLANRSMMGILLSPYKRAPHWLYVEYVEYVETSVVVQAYILSWPAI